MCDGSLHIIFYTYCCNGFRLDILFFILQENNTISDEFDRGQDRIIQFKIIRVT